MKNEQKKFLPDFKGAKGPDFISRLRGYVNILDQIKLMKTGINYL